jgi:Holliday junction DNA helicase RuvA
VIASVRGRLAAADADGLVVEVGGVGLRLQVTRRARTLAEADPGQVALVTYLAVREDALTLYGFASQDERDLFGAFLGVSGLGPKLALALVSAYPPDTLRRALASGDVALFTQVPGIGRKLAQRLVLELRDSLAPPASADVAVPGAEAPPPDDLRLARDALCELGYSLAEAEQRLDGTTGSAEERVRQALLAGVGA